MQLRQDGPAICPKHCPKSKSTSIDLHSLSRQAHFVARKIWKVGNAAMQYKSGVMQHCHNRKSLKTGKTQRIAKQRSQRKFQTRRECAVYAGSSHQSDNLAAEYEYNQTTGVATEFLLQPSEDAILGPFQVLHESSPGGQDVGHTDILSYSSYL